MSSARSITQSIRARLAWRHAAMLAAIVLIIEGGSYLAVVRLLAQRGDRLLASASTALVRDMRTELDRGKETREAISTAVHDLRFGDVTLAIEPIETPALVPVGDVRFDTRADTSGENEIRSRSEIIDVRGTRWRVVASRSRYEDLETLEAVQRAYVTAAALAILLSALVTWFMASAALRPVAHITERAASIGSDDLHQRLPVSAGNDELSRLSHVLNDMLQRIDDSFAQQRQFVADASHELRTPIAILRTEIDVTRARPARSATEYEETLARLHRITGRLERLVADLFLLARIDAEGVKDAPVALDASELARATATLLESVAHERGVRIGVSANGPAVVMGHEQLLERVLLNLLDNALRFAPRESEIMVRVTREASTVVVDVIDQGPGIDSTLRETLFDRFRRRVPSSTERAHDGAGLGLAIAYAIVAQAHEGSLTLHATNDSGSTFRMVLPAA